MKAAVSTGVGQGFRVHDVEIADPVGREVLIDVKASGLCHSDLHLVENDFGFPMPAVFGHEAAGVIAKVGPDVTTMKPGDHVVACLIQFCGNCEACLSGRTFECEHPEQVARQNGPARLSEAGAVLTQAFGIGGFAEQALIHENQLAVVNADIPFPQACLLGCGTVTGAGAAINSAGVRFGDTVAVIGTGGVGLNVINGARVAGATRIIAIDIADMKLEAAKKFGATDVINSSAEDAVQRVRELTGGGVDFAFEVIGLTVTQKQAVELVKPGGTALLVGLGKPGAAIDLPTSVEALEAHKTVRSVYMGSTNLKRDIPAYAALYTQGRLNLDDLVSQEIAIEQVDEAYEQLKRGEVIRSIITSF